MAKKKTAKPRLRKSRLTIQQILAWADAHHRRTKKWPRRNSGRVVGGKGEQWQAVDESLRQGYRGLKGDSSLAQLLAKRRNARNRAALPKLTDETILKWADAHFRRNKKWPIRFSGRIVDSPGDTWQAVHEALQKGCRGVRKRMTLAQFLSKKRNVRYMRGQPNLTERKILAWADRHHLRKRKWPTARSGRVTKYESWAAINQSLRRGYRGLRGGRSLAELLDKHRRK
jgi:hypothetical protein